MINLSETTKKLDKEYGEKIIPPMMNNTFFGNEQKEKDIFKKVSLISKKTFLIGISINKIFDKLISLLTASDELDQLELSSPNVSRTKSEVRKAPSLKPDNSLGGLGFGLIVAAILAAVGYKILQLVTEKLITPMIDGITSLFNKIIDAYSSAAIAFISAVTSSMEAAVNSATFAFNTLTDSIYSLEIGLEKAYRSVVGTTKETEERIDSLEKQKISKRDETTAKGESIKKTIQEEEISLVSAVSDTSQEIKDTITRTGQSIKDTVYLPPISKVLTSFGGIPGAIPPSTIPGGGPGVGVSDKNYRAPGFGEFGNPKVAMNFFIERGYTPEQAAGIVGNLQAESGANLKTNSKGDFGAAYGIAQWQGIRQTNYETRFKKGKSIRDSTFMEQLEYIDWELNNTHTSARDAIKSAKTVEDAARIVDYRYEISARLHTSRRITNAQALLADYMNINKDKVYVVDNRKPPVNSGNRKPKAQQRQRVSSYLGNFGDYFGTGDTTGIPNYA